jgi:hypothetical protein
MRIPVEEVTPDILETSDVILVSHRSLPGGIEQLWADLNVPKVPPWPKVPHTVKVLEITLDTSDRKSVHELQQSVRKVKGRGWSRSPATEAGYLENGAIRLMSDRVPPEILDEFRRLFGCGLACVPPDSLACIMEYWRKATAPKCCQGKPHVKSQYDPQVRVGASWGVPKATCDGHDLYFPIHALADIGEELAVVAIAHELAHVTFYASGEPNHWQDTSDPAAYAVAERLVDARLLEWNTGEGVLRRLDQWLKGRGFKRT